MVLATALASLIVAETYVIHEDDAAGTVQIWEEDQVPAEYRDRRRRFVADDAEFRGVADRIRAEGNPKVLVHLSIDRARAWVGEEVLLSVHVVLRIDQEVRKPPEGGLISEPVGLDFFNFAPPLADGFLVEPLEIGTATDHPLGVFGDRLYRVQTLARYALFPTRPGRLHVEPIDALARWREQHTMTRSQRFSVQVSAPLGARRPSACTETSDVGDWGLRAEVPSRGTVATPLVYRAIVKGKGNLSHLAGPEPRWTAEDFDVAGAPTTTDEPSKTATEYGGVRTIEWTLVPKRAGVLTVPALTWPVFDTRTRRCTLLSAAARRIVVVERAGNEPTPATTRRSVGSQGAAGDRWVSCASRVLAGRAPDVSDEFVCLVAEKTELREGEQGVVILGLVTRRAAGQPTEISPTMPSVEGATVAPARPKPAPDFPLTRYVRQVPFRVHELGHWTITPRRSGRMTVAPVEVTWSGGQSRVRSAALELIVTPH